MKKLRINFPNWKDLTIETINFFYSECEKRLNESLITFKNNKDRAYRILAAILPLLIITVGYLFSIETPDRSLLPVYLFVVFELGAVLLLIKVILPQSVQTTGALPSKLIVPAQIKKRKGDLQYIELLLNCCENMEAKIIHNQEQNDRMAHYLKLAIIAGGITAPLAFIIVFAFSG